MKPVTKVSFIFSLLSSLLPFGWSDRRPSFGNPQKKEVKRVVCPSQPQQEAHRNNEKITPQRNSGAAGAKSADSHPPVLAGDLDGYRPYIPAQSPNSYPEDNNAGGHESGPENNPEQKTVYSNVPPRSGFVPTPRKATFSSKVVKNQDNNPRPIRSVPVLSDQNRAPNRDRNTDQDLDIDGGVTRPFSWIPGSGSGSSFVPRAKTKVDPRDKKDSDVSRDLTPGLATIAPVADLDSSAAAAHGSRLIVPPAAGRVAVKKAGARDKAKVEPKKAKAVKKGEIKTKVAAKKESATAKEVKKAEVKIQKTKEIKPASAEVKQAAKKEKPVVKEVKPAHVEVREAREIKPASAEVKQVAKKEMAEVRTLEKGRIEALQAKKIEPASAEVKKVVPKERAQVKELKEGRVDALEAREIKPASAEVKQAAKTEVAEVRELPPCEKCVQEHAHSSAPEKTKARLRGAKSPVEALHNLRATETPVKTHATIKGEPFLITVPSELVPQAPVAQQPKKVTPHAFSQMSQPSRLPSMMSSRVPRMDMPIVSNMRFRQPQPRREVSPRRLPLSSARPLQTPGFTAARMPRPCVHTPMRVRLPRGGGPAQQVASLAGNVALNFALDGRIRGAALEGTKSVGSKVSGWFNK